LPHYPNSVAVFSCAGVALAARRLAIIGAMLVAIATVHLKANGCLGQQSGYEFNLTLIRCSGRGYASTGPGAYSLDSALRIHLPEPVDASGRHHSL